MPSAAEHQEATLRHFSEDLEEPSIGRSVDAAGTNDHKLESGSASRVPANLLPFQFRFLVDVPRTERRILVRRRVLDIAVDADGAALHNAADAGPPRNLDDRSDGGRIDGPIDGRGEPSLAVERGDVVDDVHAGHRTFEARGIREIAFDDLDRGAREHSGLRAIPHERADVVAAFSQKPRKPSACEACRAGDQRLHRSATSVTGDPNSRDSPTDVNPCSTVRVNPRLPIALWNAIGSTN